MQRTGNTMVKKIVSLPPILVRERDFFKKQVMISDKKKLANHTVQNGMQQNQARQR